MKRVLLAGWLTLLLTVLGQAQFFNPPLIFSGSVVYQGPGDVVSGALAWYGFRAYSLAKAGNKAVNLVRASDSATQDINTLASGSFDAASAATFCAATTCKVVTWYDQTQGTSCVTGVACDNTQSMDATRATYTALALSSKPCATFSGSNAYASTALASTTSQPVSHSFVTERTGANTSIGAVLDTNNTVTSGFNSGTNTLIFFAGSVATATATDGAFHAVNVAYNGASSSVNVDGSSTSISTGASTTLGVVRLGFDNVHFLTGILCEAGIWPSGFSAGNQTIINSQQHSFWVF